MGVELVDTTRLWMRRASILEPEWVELVAPHLCESHYSGARWDREQGAVYAVERVVCGGLRIIDNRRVHYGRINPAHAREIMIREGLVGRWFPHETRLYQASGNTPGRGSADRAEVAPSGPGLV